MRRRISAGQSTVRGFVEHGFAGDGRPVRERELRLSVAKFSCWFRPAGPCWPPATWDGLPVGRDIGPWHAAAGAACGSRS